MFDSHLEQVLEGKHKQPDHNSDDHEHDLTIQVLRFTKLLVANSTDPGVYNSHEVRERFLSCEY